MRISIALLAMSVLPLLSGCAKDPFERPGTWHLPPAGAGANDTNLRAMLVNPRELETGTSEAGSTGPLSARPIDQLFTGRRRPLPSVNASQIGAGTQQQGAAAGGAGGPGSQ